MYPQCVPNVFLNLPLICPQWVPNESPMRPQCTKVDKSAKNLQQPISLRLCKVSWKKWTPLCTTAVICVSVSLWSGPTTESNTQTLLVLFQMMQSFYWLGNSPRAHLHFWLSTIDEYSCVTHSHRKLSTRVNIQFYWHVCIYQEY